MSECDKLKNKNRPRPCAIGRRPGWNAAARTMAESPGAMQLRTLQTIDGLGASASNTVVIAVPVELLDVCA